MININEIFPFKTRFEHQPLALEYCVFIRTVFIMSVMVMMMVPDFL